MPTVDVPPQISNAYKKSYRKLSRLERRRVDTTIQKFLDHPDLGGLNFEKLSGTDEDVYSIRVTIRIRLIMRWNADGVPVLDYVGQHQQAYRRADQLYMMLADREGIPHADFETYTPMVREPMLSGDVRMDLERQLREAKIDTPNIADLAGMLDGMIEEMTWGGTSGRAGSPESPDGAGGTWINVIPSEQEGPCTDVLLAFCFDADSFRNRLDEIHHHAGVRCPRTKLIILITSKWDPKSWKQHHRNRFADLTGRLIVLMAVEGQLTRVL